MTRSPAKTPPPPVRTGRYRYSKLRWRVSVAALDLVGALAMTLWRLFRPRAATTTPRRILLVQLDHLGDAVLTSPLIERLRAAYPQAAIDVLASASNHELFSANPHVSRVRLAERSWFERRRGRSALLSAVWTLGRSLRGSGYDLGIDVRGDILTVFVLTLAGIPRRVGWTMGGGGFLLTDTASWIPGRHEVESRLALLAALGISDELPARVVVHVDDADRVEVASRLREAWNDQEATIAKVRIRPRGRARRRRSPHVDREPIWDEPDALHAGRFGTPPLLALHLGAGTAAKRWPPGRWRVLIAKFLADGWRIVVVGGPDDVEASVALTTHENLRDWTGLLTVTQTAALLERAELFIGADSGPSHLAAAAGTPSVILFSGTNRVVQWRPWSRRSLVLRRRVPCAPCHCKICPLADHPCMTELLPDRVYRAAARWWAPQPQRESPHVSV